VALPRASTGNRVDDGACSVDGDHQGGGHVGDRAHRGPARPVRDSHRRDHRQYGIAWLLLFSGVRVILEHWDDAGDAQILQQQTRIMPVVFARIWLAGAIFALILGARLMM
jgi:hypothetical protein